MKTFRVHFKSKGGDQTMLLQAPTREKAEQEAQRVQARRHDRFQLTFARLDQAAQTGDAGMLAIDPRFGKAGLTEAWVKAEIAKRKRDQARYDDGTLKIVSVEEMK